MPDKKRSNFSPDYLDQLKSINNINFTSREIDIIACLLNARGTSRTASFLAISPKTVVNHIRNVMVKMGCNSREGIIDFIEISNKQSLLRTHYSNLILDVAFKVSLKAISRFTHKLPLYSLVCWEKQEGSYALLEKIKSYLELAGIKTHLEVRSTKSTITHLMSEAKDENYRIYLMTESVCDIEHTAASEEMSADPIQVPLNALFLRFEKEEKGKALNDLCEVECVNFTKQENYYFPIFEILKKLLPNAHLERIIAEFKTHYELTHGFAKRKSPQGDLEEQKELSLLLTKESFLKKRKWSVLSILIVVMSFLSVGFFILKGGKEFKVTHFLAKQLEPLICSGLILPSKTALLDRPELMMQINSKFKDQSGIQTISFVGIGGSGKTTTARHYTHQQQANVVWEINAETNTSLMESFENLAYSLSKTEEDKKILRELQEIKNSVERSKKLVEFVKERLKLHSNWFLIYDNVEDFKRIQKYFPTDVNTWGEGKVILTTRNQNIQNNRHVDGIILMGELNSNQKLALFIKIMNHGENKKLTALHKEELMEFLEKIPPFPLDVSVAAYYLKTTNIPYANYLECLDQQDTNFTTVQENLLKEAGEYTKTRNSIITLSLKHVIDTHKDFGDLLLFISLLDSQNIPKELLDAYKEKNVVDNFIYYLKKYSLITTEPSVSALDSTLSIHRSTQAIILSYLVQQLDFEKNHPSIVLIGNTLKNHIRNMLEKEDFPKMKTLVRHSEAFLSHDNLLPNVINGVIHGELGHLYCNLAKLNKAEEFLKKSLLILKNCPKKDYNLLFRPLSYLGIVYWSMGEFEKTKALLKQSVEIYKKFNVTDHNGLCQALTYLGILYTDQGDFKKARGLLEQSLLKYRTSNSKNYSGLAFTVAQLGDLYSKSGNYKKAKFYLEKSLVIYKKYITNNNPNIGWALGNLGAVYTALGDFEKAESLHKKNLIIYKQYYPQNSPNVAWVLRNLGNTYNAMGEFKKAQNFLEQSFMLFKEKLGENNIKTKWVLLQLGIVYKNIGDLKKARIFLEDCLLTSSKGSLYAGWILLELGEVSLLENNLGTAEDFLGRALYIYQKNKHPRAYKCLEAFSDLYLKKSENSAHKRAMKDAQYFNIQAINALKNALAIVKSHFPEDSPHIKRIQDKLIKLKVE